MGIALDKLSPAQVEKYLHVQAEISEQTEDQQRVRDLRDYYYGRHPTHLTDRQEEFLGPILTECDFPFCHNLMQAVVDVLRERLNVTGLTVEGADSEAEGPTAGEQVAATVWEWWEDAGMAAKQIKLWRRSLRDRKSYIILDWNGVANRPDIFVNSAYDGDSGMTFRYDPDTDEPWIATKYWWSEEWDGKGIISIFHKTVYLAHEIWKFKRDMEKQTSTDWQPAPDATPDGFEPWPYPWVDSMGEPLGLPVIEFANPSGSEIEQLIQLQNAVNKGWLDAIAAADVAAFGLPYIRYEEAMSGGAGQTLEEDEEGEAAIRHRPGALLEVDAAEVGKLPADDIEKMLAIPMGFVMAIAGTSRTPQYYLRPIGGADVPSGEALKQLEAGLVAKATERQVMFGAELVRMFGVAMRMYNEFSGKKVDADVELEIAWASAEVRNETYDADVAQKHKLLGVPNKVLWARLGYTPEQTKEFEAALSLQRAEEIAEVVGAVRRAEPVIVGAGG